MNSADTPVSVAFVDDLALVTIDNPPVNATSLPVRAGLMAAVRQVDASDARVAILACAGRSFIAGGDIAEFDRPPRPPVLPEVVDAIEAARVPWIAALHGTVLGGGFEVALAAAWRVALPGTRFGLPEVKLGLIPGAGATQRLPRLIGIAAAARLAALGQPIEAEALRDLGGLDALIAAESPVAAARAFARDLPPRPPALALRPAPAPDPAAIEAVAAEARRRMPGQNAPVAALEAVARAASLPFAEGLRAERETFLALKDGAQSKALRHLFFAERAQARPRAIRDADPRPVDHVAVVGGGLMGSGIAMACLSAGLRVTVIERDPKAAAAARDRITGLLDGAVRRGKLDAGGRAAALERLVSSDRDADAAGASLAIEAVFEDLAVKRAVFQRLHAVLGPDAILATNTSYLDPGRIAEAIPGPDRVLGLHFFSPAHVMRLVEVVATPDTARDVLATGFGLARRLGKVGVLSRVCEGFIGNRILTAYRRQADYMLADGCLPAEVDAAMRGFGMPMGPYALQDLTGLQIAWATRQRQAATRDPAERYVPIADRLCAAGRFGQATGAGWYAYGAGSRQPEPDPRVTAIIEAWRAEAGISPTRFPEDEIRARLLAVMVNEGWRIVEEGIAEDPGAVDVVKVLGYGFPRWRGGPLHWAEAVGLDTVRSAMARVADQSPGSWAIADRLR